MAPFKSSLAKSAGKLLGVFRQGDLSLRGASQVSRKVSTFIINVPTSVNSPGTWDLSPGANGQLVLSAVGTYDISMSPTNIGDSGLSIDLHVWGAGGGAGNPKGKSGGGGGFSRATMPMTIGTTYKVVVGGVGSNSTPGGNAPQYAGYGGGYSGIFLTSVTHGNSIMVSGGGGGGGGDTNGNNDGYGGSGGGTVGQDGESGDGAPGSNGKKGTQSAGGTGGSGYGGGQSGSALAGGYGGPQGAGGDGGGGGAGYYGGGGGAGTDPPSQGGGGGGGGSSYIGHPLLLNAETTGSGSSDRSGSSPYIPSLPSSAGRGNNEDNHLSLPTARNGGDGAIIIAAAV